MKVLYRTHNVRTRSNENIAHVANASADLRSFNRVCVYVRLQPFAIVRLHELARDHIDTQATSFFTLWCAVCGSHK